MQNKLMDKVRKNKPLSGIYTAKVKMLWDPMSKKWTEYRGSTEKGVLTLCLTMELLDNSTILHSLLNITASNHFFYSLLEI